MRGLFQKIKAKMDRRAHVKRMMAGIECARTMPISGKQVSKTFGLRALRDFEQINGVAWDQKCILHSCTLSGMGVFKYLIWIRKRVNNQLRVVASAMEPSK